MSRNKYTPEFKAKVCIPSWERLEVLQGERELNAIASEYSISPNMLRNWKNEFVRNAGRVFNESRVEKDIRRKEADLEQERNQMLKTIGQLTMERDFLYKLPQQSRGKFFKAGMPPDNIHKLFCVHGGFLCFGKLRLDSCGCDKRRKPHKQGLGKALPNKFPQEAKMSDKRILVLR